MWYAIHVAVRALVVGVTMLIGALYLTFLPPEGMVWVGVWLMVRAAPALALITCVDAAVTGPAGRGALIWLAAAPVAFAFPLGYMFMAYGPAPEKTAMPVVLYFGAIVVG